VKLNENQQVVALEWDELNNKGVRIELSMYSL